MMPSNEMLSHISALQNQLTEANKTISELRGCLGTSQNYIEHIYGCSRGASCICGYHNLQNKIDKLIPPPTETSKGDE